jgi:hypothetical protein
MPITPEGIAGHSISEDEFRLLKYIDGRFFLSSSTSRFTDWDSSFSTAHPDWKKRIEVQSALADLAFTTVGETGHQAGRQMIFLGASKGSIATYFHMAALRRAGILDDFHISILDFLMEPLLVTQRGDFEVSEQAERDIGLSETISISEFKQRLSQTTLVQGNVCDTGLPDSSYDVVVAPYIQHHLSLLDKRRACAEMLRVVKSGGILLLGDLTFDYRSFLEWLSWHTTEDVPYALESFVSMEEHKDMFGMAEYLAGSKGSYYYSLAMRRPAS